MIIDEPQELFHILTALGHWPCRYILDVSISNMHPCSIHSPSQKISLLSKQMTFTSSSLRPNFRNLARTFTKLAKVSSKVSPRALMSSRYTMTISRIIPTSTICMAHWNVAGATHSPNCILTNWYSPNFVINAILPLSSSAITICQYPEFISRVQNQVLPTKLSRHSSIKGNGYASFSVLELTSLKSMQYLQEPSRLWTSTGGAAHSEWLCSITPAASIWSSVAFSCFSKPSGVRLIDCLIEKDCPVFR